MTKGFVANIEDITVRNDNFRKVIFTSKNIQLVVMSIPPMGEIGEEVHATNDQFLRIESGMGVVTIDGIDQEFSAGFCILVPAGSNHNIKNTSDSDELKIYTLYSPPHHRMDVVHATREEAEKDTEEFDGKVNE